MSPTTTRLLLRPIDPDCDADLAELCSQREACGWGVPVIPKYMQAVKRGDMLYYLVYLSNGTTIDGPIGSGGIDLAGASEPTLASRERSEFCVMGLFLRAEYRNKGISRRLARYLINCGFEQFNQKSCGVMTLLQNPLTNYMFQDFGFVEFSRKSEPEWNVGGAWGVSYRLTKSDWQRYVKSLDESFLNDDRVSIDMHKPSQ